MSDYFVRFSTKCQLNCVYIVLATVYRLSLQRSPSVSRVVRAVTSLCFVSVPSSYFSTLSVVILSPLSLPGTSHLFLTSHHSHYNTIALNHFEPPSFPLSPSWVFTTISLLLHYTRQYLSNCVPIGAECGGARENIGTRKGAENMTLIPPYRIRYVPHDVYCVFTSLNFTYCTVPYCTVPYRAFLGYLSLVLTILIRLVVYAT